MCVCLDGGSVWVCTDCKYAHCTSGALPCTKAFAAILVYHDTLAAYVVSIEMCPPSLVSTCIA